MYLLWDKPFAGYTNWTVILFTLSWWISSLRQERANRICSLGWRRNENNTLFGSGHTTQQEVLLPHSLRGKRRHIPHYTRWTSLNRIMSGRDNENSVHILWTHILLHTREPLVNVYNWVVSFELPVMRITQCQGTALKKAQVSRLKQLISKQITDAEKLTITTINTSLSLLLISLMLEHMILMIWRPY